ncbi:hypothetical [Yersinia pestis KIM10+]|uniref:Uncharacterized protein n=1 Tax=Yersinia pestis TaxID=632 RepID=Q8CKM9_YERPE|nr:hypothetical [Yersinia pestis KIM10+]
MGVKNGPKMDFIRRKPGVKRKSHESIYYRGCGTGARKMGLYSGCAGDQPQQTALPLSGLWRQRPLSF